MRESEKLPKEFVEKMEELLKEEAAEFFESYGQERRLGLRINPLKVQGELPGFLSSLEKIPWAAEGRYYGAEDRPGKHPYHEAGLYYIQEPSAMAAAVALKPAPGERILDLCAAPGGKTTHIAGRMGGSGLLVSNEIHPARARILSQNVERMGISNCVVTNEAPGRLAPVFEEFFDGIAVDAPCSGEGMFRKDENARGEWSPEQVALCAGRQDEILDCAAAMLKAGGRLVYSTCTFSPEENEGTVERFLLRHRDFYLERPDCAEWFSEGRPQWADGSLELKKTVRIWPHKSFGEGHFLALLRKAGSLEAGKRGEPAGKPEGRRGKKSGKEKDGKQEAELFFQSSLSEEGRRRLKESSGSFLWFGENLYLFPDCMPSMEGIRVLRPGLHLGTLKKGRLEPSHALALYLRAEDVNSSMELGTEEAAARYLRGETIPAGKETAGWTLVTVDGYSLGWGKAAGGILKNHYPKGLRQP